MLINELSKRTGVSIHTLRYYENLGLIKGKTDENVQSNNYKQYDEIVLEKINWIIEAKKVDLTLAEIKTLLQDWFNDKLTPDEKIELVDKKIIEVDIKINHLQDVKNFMLQAKVDVQNGLC